MPRTVHRWEFKARFRRHAFGWKSRPAIIRIRQAVAEIRKVAKEDAIQAAEGAITFLERLSPALEHIDSSSGAIGTAVNHAIADLVPVIATARADAGTREAWLERIWDAYQEDEIPYIETLGDHWGELCASEEVASAWADRLEGIVRQAWNPDPGLRGFFKGTTNCLSAFLAARRYEDVLALLEIAPYKTWHYRQYGVRALAAMGRKADASRYAEESRGLNDGSLPVARACEEVLLSSGLADEAYARYGLAANRAGTYLATFRAVAAKYPHKSAIDVLSDLVKTTPGEEGKWFAAAKEAGLFEQALALASRTPCDPRTLARAARDYSTTQPDFAIGAGLLALHWLVQGYGYEITGADVWAAYASTMEAAERLGRVPLVKERIRSLMTSEGGGRRFVTEILAGELGP
ncbi:MAG: hypothetical protein ACRD1X_02040 [Vicinamibacteria bacterium]